MRMNSYVYVGILVIYGSILILQTDCAELDRCTFYQGNCAYHVVLAGSNCNMVQADSPDPYYYRQHDEPVKDPPPPPVKEVIVKEEIGDESSKKLDALERRLLKMMEGLSVRSLRHMRQIKAELKEVTTNLNMLQQKNRRKKGMTCPPNFISVGAWSSCYRFSEFNASWHEAREYCSAFGANLVALDTLKESYIIDYLIKSNPAFFATKAWWTAGNYIVRNRKWMWTSRHHLKPINYSRWAPKEPNARSTMHCMMLYKAAQYQWHDAMCSDKNNFVCEIEIF